MTSSKMSTSVSEKKHKQKPMHDPVLTREASIEDGVVSSGTFRKDLSWLGILAAGFNVSNSWLVIAATLTISIGYGPMVTTWGLIVVTFVFTCIGLSIAELVSVYPTPGGQYHWTSILAPKSIHNFISYVCGFISWFSWIAMAASSTSAIWTCVATLVGHSYPEFVQHPWMPFLCFQGFNILVCVFNIFGKKSFAMFYTAAFFLSLAAFITFFIISLATKDQFQPSKVIWTEYNLESGWPAGVQFLIGLAAPVVAFCPLDGAVHLVEEVKNARKVVPRTVMVALTISFITSLAFLLATLYCVKDFTAILTAGAPFPLFTIWQQITSTDVIPIVFTVITIALLPVGSVACVQVASMMTWSLGRDGGLPFGGRLSRINPRLNVPVTALCFNFCILFLIGCLNLFSALAFNSIVSVTVILQQLTIASPIFFLIYHGRSEKALPSDRVFKLPNWLGWIVNLVTLAFTGITSTFFLMPAVHDVTEATMNYACVVVGGVLIAGLLNWINARKSYKGPTNVCFYD